MKYTFRLAAAAALLAGLSAPGMASAEPTQPALNSTPIAAFQTRLQNKITDAGTTGATQSEPRSLPQTLPVSMADLRTLNFGTPVFGYDDPVATSVPSETPDRDAWIAGP